MNSREIHRLAFTKRPKESQKICVGGTAVKLKTEVQIPTGKFPWQRAESKL